MNYLPPIAKPPHDPTSFLMNERTGWREAYASAELGRNRHLLALALRKESRRSFTEPNGCFGNLVMPANVALGPDASIYLLDTRSLRLKRFEPCACRFEIIPCLGGEGSEARQLLDPHGIAIGSGNLYICDTGNHRLSVFSLHRFVLRDHWEPPPDAAQATPWQPSAVACDSLGRVYVSDTAHFSIDRFSASGEWETRYPIPAQVNFLAIDSYDRLLAVIQGTEGHILILDSDGEPAGVAFGPEEVASRFPVPLFDVDAFGQLHLGPLCAAAASSKGSEWGIFDQFGDPVVKPQTAPAPAYFDSGIWRSGALDSKLYRCQWHRIVLRGRIPEGACIVVSTFTAEAELAGGQLEAPKFEGWQTRQTATALNGGEWDCLVLSGPGRFLWLQLEFGGNGRTSPELDSIEVEFPRISLRRYLPAVFGAEPISADFTDRFLSLFDTTLRSIEHKIDNQASYFDPLSAPAERNPKTERVDFLTWLGSWIGLSLDRHWPEAKRREFLKNAGRLYAIRGTREALWQQLVLYLDMKSAECVDPGREPRSFCCSGRPKPSQPKVASGAWSPPPLILEHFRLRRWLSLGSGRLGDQAELWGRRIVNRSQLSGGAQPGQSQLIATKDPFRDPFHVYAHKFTVFVPAAFGRTDQYRKALDNLLRAESPSHAQYAVQYVEPRFRIGVQSAIGLDSVIGRYPLGVTLNLTLLGPASVLDAPCHKKGGPSLEIGINSRIDSTTVLD